VGEINNNKKLNTAKLGAFSMKVLGDMSGTFIGMMCYIGDRLGLFKTLLTDGSGTSKEIANRLKIDERYTREWLSSLTSAKYLEYNPSTKQFTLPPEHAELLAQDYGVCGAYQQVSAFWEVMDKVLDSFKNGGGVSPSSYSDDLWKGMEKLTGSMFEELLIEQWLPLLPEIQENLNRGIKVADIGCGWGKAILKLASEFPNSKFTGYDILENNISTAISRANKADVSSNTNFKQIDVIKGIPEKFDLITVFDVIHDLANPKGGLIAIKDAVKPKGVLLLLDMKCSEKLEENITPIAPIMYGISIMYCMTQSLSQGGEGLGTMGLPPSKVRKLCIESGFSEVNEIPINSLFNILYSVIP
jgi:2-polyprenyl-3-methyl-5-hydroxy-6-metoxy-1,4-benzoquinol methylase